MATNNVSAPPPATAQQVDPNRFGVDIHISKDSHPINVDLGVEMLFLQYNQLTNLQTQDKMDETKATLKEMSDARDMYNRMKDLKHQAQNNKTSEMPKDMQDYLDARGIKYDMTGNDNIHDPDEWDINMTNLDSYVQKVSGQNKTQMLELNQKVEDGNNSLREVSTVISKHNEILQSIIQTINR